MPAGLFRPGVCDGRTGAATALYMYDVGCVAVPKRWCSQLPAGISKYTSNHSWTNQEPSGMSWMYFGSLLVITTPTLRGPIRSCTWTRSCRPADAGARARAGRRKNQPQYCNLNLAFATWKDVALMEQRGASANWAGRRPSRTLHAVVASVAPTPALA